MNLSKGEWEQLDYFWNGKKKEVRKVVIPFLAAYLEEGNYEGLISDMKATLINMGMIPLELKGLVVRIQGKGVNDNWSITAEGEIKLRSRHPTLKNNLEHFIESTPAIGLIISGIIGFVASIAGLIQFYDWIFNTK